MRFSTSIEYAIHGLIYLANSPKGTSVMITNVARATKVPEAYLRKVFQQLTRGGILLSKRGMNGGFYLDRDPREITLKDIVEAIDGSLPIYSCLRTTRRCGLATPCPVHEAFEQARLRMAEVLEATSVKDLLEDISRKTSTASWLDVMAC